MRPLEDAQRDVLAAISSTETVRSALEDALGLVIAREVLAPHDIPPFRNSAMDGYAVRAVDVASVPVTLPVQEDVPAGSVASAPLVAGNAIKIMTGAPLPDGADTVVKVEDTVPGDDSVEILTGAPFGTAVREAGGDVGVGQTVVAAGDRITPAHLGVLASVGETHPVVYRRPVVGIMSTGDEVVPPETGSLAPGKIRDANGPLLFGLLTELGVTVQDFGIIPDDAELLRAVLEGAAKTCDAVFTSGGVSMGEYDLVKQVLGELGTIEFWQVAMKPAKPFAFGLIEGTPLFGLPGNPVSSMVAFEQFGRPALLTMMGSGDLFRPRLSAVALEDIVTDPAKTVFVRGITVATTNGWEVRTSGGQESNVLSAVAAGNCFIVVERDKEKVAAGDTVQLEMFQWSESRSYQEVLG